MLPSPDQCRFEFRPLVFNLEHFLDFARPYSIHAVVQVDRGIAVVNPQLNFLSNLKAGTGARDFQQAVFGVKRLHLHAFDTFDGGESALAA